MGLSRRWFVYIECVFAAVCRVAVNRVDTDDDDVVVVHVRTWQVLEDSCVSFCLRRTCHVTSVTRTYSHTS